MLVLHAAWKVVSPAPPLGRLFVWAEWSGGSPCAAAGDGRTRRGLRHPFAASAGDVEEAWFDLAQRAQVGAFDDVGPTGSEGLWLPSRGGPTPGPVPSPWLVFDEVDDARRDLHGAKLRPWLVPGLIVDLEIGLRVLADMPMHGAEEGGTVGPDEVVLADDLRFWSQVAKLALELAARQRFYPTLALKRTGNADGAAKGKAYAYWTPVCDDPSEQERIAALAAGLPGAAVATCEPGRGGKVAVRPREIVHHFLTTAVDTIVRWSTLASYPVGTRELDRVPSVGVAERWFAALHDEPAFTARWADLERLEAQVGAWTAELRAGTARGGFRTCFRLEPPETPHDPKPSTARRRGTGADGQDADRWRLRFFLQATDDRSLLVPASEVWKSRGQTLQYLNRRFDRPQERLLTDLGRAARLFPALDVSLRTAHPEECLMGAEDAYTFLRETAWLLEDSGFGVLVPRWWSRQGMQGPRLGVRMRVSGGQGAVRQTSRVGLGALVSYDWQLALGDARLTEEEFKHLASLKTPLVQVRGQWVELRPEQAKAIRAVWESGQASNETTLGAALRLAQGATDEVDSLPVVGVEATDWVSEVLDRLGDGKRIEQVAVPASFHGTLRPYQARGLSWLAFLRRWGLGACLADDMGLGKTIQLLALLLHVREEADGAPMSPALVVCPTSVVSNWAHEAARFAPDLRVLMHHGSERSKNEAFDKAVRACDLVITSYALVRRDRKFIGPVTWSCLVLDEAQVIKNVSTQVTQTVRQLQADHRVVLTGTPVENRLSELWSLLDFLNLGYLGSLRRFKQEYATPIERYQDPEATRRLQALVRPFVLRRLKSDPDIVADLPEKMEMKVYCSLTREQATLYEAIVQQSLAEIEEATGIRRKGVVLATLTRLKQVCNHPAHFLQDGSPVAGRSGKLARLTEMLEEVMAEGDRALVFTQFVEMGHMLRGHLQTSLGREVLFLYGGTPARRRTQMVDRFQHDEHGPAVFLLSLKAGGLGLNLTRANHVFHFDRWWNPAVENQATDRAFRIGQTRNVLAHKFVCSGTIEERIDEMIESKKGLADSVVAAGESWLTELSTDRLRDMMALGPEAVMGDE